MTVTIQSGIAAWRFPIRETTGSGRSAGLPTASGASPAPGSQRGSDRFQLVRLCSFTQLEFPKAQPLASRERTDRDCCHPFGGSMRKAPNSGEGSLGLQTVASQRSRVSQGRQSYADNPAAAWNVPIGFPSCLVRCARTPGPRRQPAPSS